MRRIAIINQKGGVGKTTTTANLGAALAQAGKKTFLVDLDPQGHLTLHFGLSVQPDQATVYDVLTASTPVAEAKMSAREHIDVLPADIDLAAAESELVSVTGREVLLREALDAFGNSYDAMLIDCAPSLGVLTINALAACSEVVIPLQAHFFALQGLSKLLDTVVLVRQRINPQLKVSGIALCMHEASTRLASEIAEDLTKFLEAARGGDKPWAAAQLYQTAIRRNIKLAESSSFGQTVFDYAPKSNGAIDYANLAAEIFPGLPKARVTEEEPATSETGAVKTVERKVIEVRAKTAERKVVEIPAKTSEGRVVEVPAKVAAKVTAQPVQPAPVEPKVSTLTPAPLPGKERGSPAVAQPVEHKAAVAQPVGASGPKSVAKSNGRAVVVPLKAEPAVAEQKAMDDVSTLTPAPLPRKERGSRAAAQPVAASAPKLAPPTVPQSQVVPVQPPPAAVPSPATAKAPAKVRTPSTPVKAMVQRNEKPESAAIAHGPSSIAAEPVIVPAKLQPAANGNGKHSPVATAPNTAVRRVAATPKVEPNAPPVPRGAGYAKASPAVAALADGAAAPKQRIAPVGKSAKAGGATAVADASRACAQSSDANGQKEPARLANADRLPGGGQNSRACARGSDMPAATPEANGRKSTRAPIAREAPVVGPGPSPQPGHHAPTASGGAPRIADAAGV